MGEKSRRRREKAGGARGGAWEEAMERGYSLKRRGRYEKAAECFGEAIALGGEGHADPHAFMGHVLQDMGRVKEAMAHFGRAIEADPRHTMALFKKAEALLALNRVEEARVWCGRAVESDPDDAAPHHVMGNIYSRLLDFEAAIAEFGESVRIDPTNFRGCANIGASHLNARRPEEALECLDAALRVNPEYAFAHYQRAMALGMLGRESEAQKSLEKAVEHDPRYMLGDAGRHLRADRQAELNRAGWRDGRPPRGIGRIRMPSGRMKARSEKGRESDLALARFMAACEMEGISPADAFDAIMSERTVEARRVTTTTTAKRARKAGAGRAAGKGGGDTGRRKGAGRGEDLAGRLDQLLRGGTGRRKGAGRGRGRAPA